MYVPVGIVINLELFGNEFGMSLKSKTPVATGDGQMHEHFILIAFPWKLTSIYTMVQMLQQGGGWQSE